MKCVDVVVVVGRVLDASQADGNVNSHESSTCGKVSRPASLSCSENRTEVQ